MWFNAHVLHSPKSGESGYLSKLLCSSRPEDEASLDARLLTNINIEGGRGSRPFYAAVETQRLQTLMAFVYLLRVLFRILI